MNNYLDLLSQVGITLDPCDIDIDELTPEPVLPSTPHHYNKAGRAIFTSSQLEWANPEDFGFTADYEVVEEEHTAHPLALNWADECYLQKKRAVHHYCRQERFRFTLSQLMGSTVRDIPAIVLSKIPKSITRIPKARLWYSIRQILKKHGWRLYYNRIPAIISALNLVNFRTSSTSAFIRIIQDFERMHRIFKKIKTSLGRTYFPNLRYVAVRLMEKHNIVLPFLIPRTLTVKKQQSLDLMYTKIWNAIADEEAQEIEDFFK